MTSFAESVCNAQSQASSEDAIAGRRSEMYTKLTDKYHKKIKDAVLAAAQKGFKVKYMNFDRDDFKANLMGVGYPVDVQRKWVQDVLQNPYSEYLPKTEEGDPDHFQGLTFEVWGNNSFTTKISW